MSAVIDITDYEVLVKRMKTLSKAQTAFLKAYLHSKLQAGTLLVEKAVEILAAGGSGKDDKILELKKDLKALKLEEIEVDVTSSQLLMSEELTLLRNATNGITTSQNGGNNERMKGIEAENSDLRGLLEQAKLELSKISGSSSPSAKLSAGSSKDQATITQLKTQIQSLTKELENVKSIIKDKDLIISKQLTKIESLEMNNNRSVIATDTEELKSLQAKIILMEKDAEKAKNESVKQLALTARLESEKEEMEEEMAQELDDIEKSKDAEKALIIEEKLTLQNNLAVIVGEKQTLQNNLTASNNITRILSGKLSSIKSKSATVALSQRDLTTATKKDLSIMKQAMFTLLDGSLMGRLKGMEEALLASDLRYRKELIERKKLHNLVQELKGNIRVYMRCRPPTSKEREQFGSEALCVSFPQQGEVSVFNSEKNKEKNWEFDEVFDVESTQDKVYQDVSALVISVLDGYNVCIFAYGQTGSGKTWTMSGPPEDRGVNTRALDELFKRTQARKSVFKDTITVSLLEVYNEDIRDLLVEGGGSEKLEVRHGEHGNHVPGLTVMVVSNLQDVIDLLAMADTNRSSATTNMNEHSSRSHMMLTVTVISESKLNGQISRGKLNLVDLAGSERINKSGATGTALKEAQNINKSLSALGDVIAARASKQAHVPFRNSTLTFLLQDCLSQDSKTLMIVCVSPVLYNAEETFCSLNFAARVRTVELGKAGKNTAAAKPLRK